MMLLNYLMFLLQPTMELKSTYPLYANFNTHNHGVFFLFLYRDSLTPDEGPLSLSLTRYLHISPGRASLLNKARELQGSDVPCDGEDAEKLKNTKVN